MQKCVVIQKSFMELQINIKLHLNCDGKHVYEMHCTMIMKMLEIDQILNSNITPDILLNALSMVCVGENSGELLILCSRGKKVLFTMTMLSRV